MMHFHVIQMILPGFLSVMMVVPAFSESKRIRLGPENDLRQIESAIDDFIAGYNAGDVNRLMAVYDEDFLDMPHVHRCCRTTSRTIDHSLC